MISAEALRKGTTSISQEYLNVIETEILKTHDIGAHFYTHYPEFKYLSFF